MRRVTLTARSIRVWRRFMCASCRFCSSSSSSFRFRRRSWTTLISQRGASIGFIRHIPGRVLPTSALCLMIRGNISSASSRVKRIIHCRSHIDRPRGILSEPLWKCRSTEIDGLVGTNMHDDDDTDDDAKVYHRCQPVLIYRRAYPSVLTDLWS